MRISKRIGRLEKAQIAKAHCPVCLDGGSVTVAVVGAGVEPPAPGNCDTCGHALTLIIIQGV